MYIHVCTLYIHAHVVDIFNHVLPRWTQEQLKKVIAMLQDPAFDSKDIDPDLHKRMDKAVQDGRIKCFNMRESEADGDQDLHLWVRELEDVVGNILSYSCSYTAVQCMYMFIIFTIMYMYVHIS